MKQKSKKSGNAYNIEKRYRRYITGENQPELEMRDRQLLREDQVVTQIGLNNPLKGCKVC